MRIVYTNLKENDAGLKRSVRQLQVDFNSVDAPRAPGSPPRECACVSVEAKPPSPVNRPAPYRDLPVVAEGMTALRNMFIRKFVDTKSFCESGGPSLSITV